MLDPEGDGAGSESIEEKITEAAVDDHRHDSSSSSSDNETDKHFLSKKIRLFGRQKPIHTILGGGKSADIILWRNKQISAGMIAAATVMWLLFEWIGYHLLTFVCHSLILSLAMLFLWSNVSSFLNKSPLDFPEVVLPEDLFMSMALLLRDQFNQACTIFREVASGKDLKKFLYVIVALWVLSVVGSWFNFLTLLYIMFVMLQTVPLLYEMHEDEVDTYAEKAMVEFKKQYAVLDEKVLQKLPKVPFTKDIKQH
uniref:Reticulon-like protein n=1 Tax=Davidia involucrata TaxID=16924 RepID=A0A5B7CE48_DAVIN